MKGLRFIIFVLFICYSSSCTSQSVYTTKTGEKYHKNNCRYLKYSKKEITLEKVIQLGYDPCAVCKPPTSNEEDPYSSNSLVNSKEKAKSDNPHQNRATAIRCAGKTKSGNRCKRMTKSANGRCYQH